MLELHGVKAVPFHNAALALAPRTFVFLLARSSRISIINAQEWCFGRIKDYRAQQLCRFAVEIPKTCVLARFWIVKTHQS
eukprot:8331822-Pyramimonas_sp.AAC.1